ncbi:hypothetical protein OCT63_21115 [Vibrio sp. RW]|uniref:hypothetical protein n=1 Tax=Vibrio sp. RW TaxID=2998833 RepID=UPI0022CD62C8|nr:hypothetical protein [Vibrio sp. RW]MDA0146716.1 hypothetical protein [Vibrio sp. RW]
MKNNVMLSPGQRKERTRKNRKLVTNFLRDEIFTDTEVLADLLEFEQARNANKVLKAMARDELLIEHKHGRKSIWGINKTGLLFSYDDHEDIPDRFTVFRPSKFNALTFEHRKQMQLIRIKLVREGWREWTTPKPVKGQSCPDAIAISPKGERVAFEFERTLKASSRYDAILKNHLEAISERRYQRVFYLSPNFALVRRVERMFLKCTNKSMVIAKNTVTLSEATIRALFEFTSIEDFYS